MLGLTVVITFPLPLCIRRFWLTSQESRLASWVIDESLLRTSLKKFETPSHTMSLDIRNDSNRVVRKYPSIRL